MAEAQVEPPSGLGNFKGVMLCTRPDDGPKPSDQGPAPFKPTVCKTYNEQLGLAPAKSDDAPRESAPAPRNEAVARHCQWLKQLQAQMNSQRKASQAGEGEAELKSKNVKEFCERQREQVRLLREEAKKTGKEPSRKELERAVRGKPAWAKTEEQSEEIDDDMPELLDFAEGLNFDEYMNDLEFREAMCAMRGRANRLAKEQLAFHEKLCEQFNDADPEEAQEDKPIGEAAIEGAGIDCSSVADSCMSSVTRSSRKSGRDGSDWDSTTCTSETMTVNSEERSVAEQILENNPAMKKIHSVASVAKIVEKQQQAKEKGIELAVDEEAAKQKRVEALVKAIQMERAPPAPVIQVTEEIQRCNKPVDPSMLPYLYRSPAV